MPQNPQYLEQYLAETAKVADNFPNRGKKNYYSTYETFADILATEVHPLVTLVAQKKDGSFLTNHGPEHVSTVIQRAYDLLGPKGLEYITPYQVFILLSAIQIHDAGHIKGGRKEHEQTSRFIVKQLQVTVIEQRLIWYVAKVHGGQVDEDDKDTISRISEIEYFDIFPVKLQFLAALLRFADELADDQSRAALYLLSNSTDILGTSTIYHAYARALGSVTVDREAKEVKLKFDMTRKDALETFTKETGRKDADGKVIKDEKGNLETEQRFLLDEIYDRTFKMYRECIYCMRFFPNDMQIKSISIKIEIFDEDGFMPLHGSIDYRLNEKGYPLFRESSTLTMCKKELTIEDEILTGSHLKQRIEQSLASTSSL